MNTLTKFQTFRSHVLKTALLVALGIHTADARPAQDAVGMDGGAPRTWMVLPALHIQNLLIKFVLASYGKTPEVKTTMLKEAEAAIHAFAFQPRHIMRVETLAELEQIKAQYFPAFNSIKDEVKYRRTQEPPPFYTITPGSDEVQERLEDLWKAQEEKLSAIGSLRGVLVEKLNATSVRRMIFATLDHGDMAQGALSLLPDKGRLELADRMLEAVAAGVKQIEQTGSVIAGSGALKHANPGLQRFFELAIGEYFRHLDTPSKLNIVSAFLDNPDLTSPREKFELMVMNAGPQFQKLFQVYARQEGFGEDMKAIFKRLESSTRAAPYRLVEREIKQLRNLPFEWVTINPKPLGVGTMAQVHRAQIRLRNGSVKEVVVRVMKPGIKKRLQSDNETLSKIAPIIDQDPILRENNFPQITPFVNEIITMGTKELNVPNTAAAQRLAAKLYPRVTKAGGYTFRVHVPEMYDTGADSMIMVQEFIPGTSFETFAERQPQAARFAVEELSKVWIEQALMGEGFYHADLHQGNLRMGRSDDGAIQINFLDFGMTGQLNKALQTKIIALSVVLNSRRADMMADALWELTVTAENKITLPEFRRLMELELAKPVTRMQDLGDWVSLAASHGLKFPGEFTSLNRGLALITQMLANQGSQLDLSSVMKRLLLKNPAQVRNVLMSLDSMRARDWMTLGLASAGIKTAAAPRALTCQQIFAHH